MSLDKTSVSSSSKLASIPFTNTSVCLLDPYTNGNRGEVMFPLHIEDVSGYYHYRIMVNYPVSMHRIKMTKRERGDTY